MNRLTHSLLVALLLLSATAVQAEILSKEIVYHVGDSEYTGYLAFDNAGLG